MASVGVVSEARHGQTAAALVLVVAVLFFIAGAARLAFITQFLSKPVIDGFIVGLAVFVAIGQLNKLLGVPKEEGNTVENLVHVVRELPDANTATVLVSVAALALLFGCRGSRGALPAGLIVLFGSIAEQRKEPARIDEGLAGRAQRCRDDGAFPSLRCEPDREGTAITDLAARNPDNSMLLELSTKCAHAEAFQIAAETRAFLIAYGIELAGDQGNTDE